jgi:hypothetical protein
MSNDEKPSNQWRWEKTPFEGWSDQKLDGYIIMTQEMVNSCMFPKGRARFQEKLDIAFVERDRRAQQPAEQQEVQDHSELVMKEEVRRTYTHAVSGSSNPRSTQDGD